MTDSPEPDTIPDPAPGDTPRDGFPADRNLNPGPVGGQYRLPDATPENFICLRGPCRHYWYSKTDGHVGNPEGTFESMGLDVPRQHHHVCLLDDSQLTEDCVYDCSRWDPMSPREIKKLEKRRADYFRRENKIVMRVLKNVD